MRLLILVTIIFQYVFCCQVLAQTPYEFESKNIQAKILSFQVLKNSTITTTISYRNKTDKPLFIVLDPGTSHSASEILYRYATYITDNAGNRFLLTRATGISASHRSYKPLKIGPKSKATITLDFRARGNNLNVGPVFSFMNSIGLTRKNHTNNKYVLVDKIAVYISGIKSKF